MEFPGFFRAYVEGSDDPEAALEDQEEPLPALTVGEALDCRELTAARGTQTKPPARYTEATLVKALEAEGIGRPSTYASIIGTIVDRGYVLRQRKELVPTFTAFSVTHLLEEHFPRPGGPALHRRDGAASSTTSPPASAGGSTSAASSTSASTGSPSR